MRRLIARQTLGACTAASLLREVSPVLRVSRFCSSQSAGNGHTTSSSQALIATKDKSGQQDPDPSQKHHSPHNNRPRTFLQWAKTLIFTWQHGVALSVGAVMGLGCLVVLLWRPLHADTVDQTAQIASQALEDQRLREHALQLTRKVVEQLLTDRRSVVLLANALSDVLNEPNSRIAVSSFLKGLFEDHYTQEITKNFVLKTLTDPWILDQLHFVFFGLLEDVLQDAKTKEALRQCLVTSAIDALKDPELQAQTGKSVRAVMWKTIWASVEDPSSAPQPNPVAARK